MKKNYFILFVMLVSSNVMGQAPGFSPFAFGISFGGNINMSKPNNLPASEFEKKISAGYHLGVIASIRKSKFYFETGIEYLSEGYSYKTNNKEVTKPTIESYLKEHKFYALNMPLKISIPFTDKYVTHLISMGVTPKYIVKQSYFNQINFINGTIEKEVLNLKKQYSGFYPCINLAYGIEIPVNYNEESIRIEPYAQFSFISSKTSSLSNTLTGFGLRATFFWLN